MTKTKLVIDRYTKCDSGLTLNPFIHVFLFLTLCFSVGFVFFGSTETLQASVLFMQTTNVGESLVNLWGLIGMMVIVIHTIAFGVRGKIGVALMPLCIFGGFYLWLWASIVYLAAGFFFQFLVACLPNLFFWTWYTFQWRKRKRGDRVAFV